MTGLVNPSQNKPISNIVKNGSLQQIGFLGQKADLKSDGGVKGRGLSSLE